MKSEFELLAPVGNFAMLHSAIKAGADAVYFGLQDFNMRNSARNFRLGDLDKMRKICDSSTRNVKMYLTLNTIIYDDEIKQLEKIFRKIKDKVDAVICWDFSVIELCLKYSVPFHVSTQASVSNSSSAEFYKKLGAERIVLARELNLKQIGKISKIVDVECFAHGAMCVSVSGRCFLSQFIHGLSANRGQCAHPCRRAWEIKDDAGNELKLENSRVMSAKDLCTLPFVDKMKKAGVKSFKIEGRNRSPEYVYVVTSVYRKALDGKLDRHEILRLLGELKKVYNRGFSSGFYLKSPTSDDFSSSENGEGTEKKEFIGKIEKYWPKIQVGALKLNSGKIKIGDEVYIIGDKTGVLRIKVESMEINHKKVKEVKKGQKVGIKLPECRKNDDVYLIKKKYHL